MSNSANTVGAFDRERWRITRVEPADAGRAMALLQRIYDRRNRLGAKGTHVPTTIPADELRWLGSIGLSPNDRVDSTHDEAMAHLLAARAEFSIADGATAFVASLDGDGVGPRGCFLEAALLAHRAPNHSHEGDGPCRECGLDARWSFDRTEDFYEWNTVATGIPGSVPWALRALSELSAWRAISPSPRARALLASALHALDTLPPTARAGAACDAVAASGLSKSAARSLVETLAFAGVLEAPPHRGLASGWVSYWDRDRRPNVRTEWDAPLGFWRGSNGVSWDNAAALFNVRQSDPIEIAPIAQNAAQIESTPTESNTPAPRKSAPRRGGLPRRPARAGDVWALRVREDAWVLAYVWAVEERGGRPFALTEFVGELAETCPEVVSDALVARPRYDGRWQYWTSGLEKATGSALLAEGRAAPTVADALPDRVAGGSAKDLVSQAGGCFDGLNR
jgi:hypothetical protein